MHIVHACQPPCRVQKSGDVCKSLHYKNVIFNNVQEYTPKITQKAFQMFPMSIFPSMKNCTKRLKAQRRHLNFQSSSVNSMSLREICFLASRHPCTSCGPHGPSSLIIVSWTSDKQYQVLCKLSLKEAEIHFVYFWTNILCIIGKYIYYLGISDNKKGK